MADREEEVVESKKAKLNGKAPVSAEMQSIISSLQKGSLLTKVCSVGRRYHRYYYVDTNSQMLAYSGSKKCLKRPDHSCILIKHIMDICDDDHGPSNKKKQKNVLLFTVVFGEQMQNLSLIAPNASVKDMWVRGLRFLANTRSVEDPVEQERMWLVECFGKSDKNRDGLLDRDEIVRLMQSLNVRSEVAQYMRDKAQTAKITIDDFVDLYKKFSERKEVRELFNRYSNDRATMTTFELSEFFVNEQHENLSESQLVDLIVRSEQCPKLKAEKQLSRVGFNMMFFLPEMNVKQPECRTVYQDMTQPLSHYFINSSHNTYLKGHQLYGNSSTEQYVRVLTHRCRCVELDVWDGDDGEPVVYHGYTLTSKILFKDALNAIDKHAFKKSIYPIILSIENHCSLDQQVRMAKHLKNVFGDKLLVEPLLEDSTTLPSPEQLKGQVIVKGKKLPPKATDADTDSDSDEAAEIEDEETQRRVKDSKKKMVKLARELSDCIVICQTLFFKSFEESTRIGSFVNISSFNENKALKLIENDGGRQYVQLNAWQLSRIYPAGARVDSSNYDPIPMWMAGCQIVALNFQTRDDPLMLNYGYFEDNGACGYVLKPEFMRSSTSSFSLDGPHPYGWTQILTIRVISGYRLPKKRGDAQSDILDPYIRVEVHGLPADKASFQTKIVRNNGFNPWWDEKFQFTITCPQLALVMFRVLDDIPGVKDPTVAQYCLPVRCLQTGYRMIELRDMKGDRLGPTGLCVHIIIDKPQD